MTNEEMDKTQSEQEVEIIDPVDPNEEIEIQESSDQALEKAMEAAKLSLKTGKKPEKAKEQPVKQKEDYVEIEDPKVQARLNDIYKQMKQAKEEKEKLANELKEFKEKVNVLHTKDQRAKEEDAENLIRQKIKEAKDSGDEDAEIRAFEELIEYKKSKEQNLQEKTPQKVNEESQDRQAYIVKRYMDETTEAGEPVRPWLYNDHPEHKKACGLAAELAMDYDENDTDIVAKVLNRLDDIMQDKMTRQPQMRQQEKQQPQRKGLDPMGRANLTTAQRPSTIRLSRAEMEVAQKLGIDPKKYYQHKERI
jgi:hypothetical protein